MAAASAGGIKTEEAYEVDTDDENEDGGSNKRAKTTGDGDLTADELIGRLLKCDAERIVADAKEGDAALENLVSMANGLVSFSQRLQSRASAERESQKRTQATEVNDPSPPSQQLVDGGNFPNNSSQGGVRVNDVSIVVPARIWATILSTYCAYEDVRSCLAANKYLWSEVPPLMDTLFVFKARELDTRYASKFANLERAFVYSLVSINEEDDDEYDDERWPPYTVICPDTAKSVVPFLECFPKLDALQLGGYGGIGRTSDLTHCPVPYNSYRCKTEGHQEIFRGMLSDLCNSFGSGSLDASSLHLYGVLDTRPYPQLDCVHSFASSGDGPCELCPRICETFPLSMIALGDHSLCLPGQERLTKVHQRDSGFLKNSGVLVRELAIHRRFGSGRVILPVSATVTWGSKSYNNVAMETSVRMIMLNPHESTFERIKFLCDSCGCDPSVEDMQPFVELHPFVRQTMRNDPLKFEGDRNYIPRELFERVVGMGFKLRESDFILVVPRPGGFGDYWTLDKCEADKWRGDVDAYEPVDKSRVLTGHPFIGGMVEDR